ncbi:MAG: DUF4139 domain-containing protein [Saprospiraceae bacterium]|nr:DUF4139 domain-containing protein [Saprospiraceae bacterium]
MKRIIIILLFFQASVYSQKITTNATDVSIFRNGAQVTRIASFYIQKGTKEYTLHGFSQYMDPRSVQIKSDGDFTLLYSSNRSNLTDSTNYGIEWSQVNGQRKALENSLQDDKNVLSTLQKEEELFYIDKSQNREAFLNNPDALLKMADLYRSRLLDIKRKITELQNKIQKQENDLQKLNTRESQLIYEYTKSSSNEFVLSISSERDQQINMTISYYTIEANWSSSYDLKVKDINSPIELISKALITQNTGEKWNQVNCTLMTGNPNISFELPFLHTWWLVSYTETNDPKIKGALTEATPYYLDGIRYQGRSINYRTAGSEVQEQLTMNEFLVKEKLTIPSDRKSITVILNTQTHPANFEYLAVPKKSKHAYLITNWEELNISTGPMGIYFANTFVGTTTLNPESIEDTLSISLGPDIATQLKRTKIAENTKKETFSSKKHSNIAWEIDIKNSKTRDIDFRIEDQIPLSKLNEVEVEPKELSGGMLDRNSGIITWIVKIPAGKSIKKTLKYQVRYPKSMKLILE